MNANEPTPTAITTIAAGDDALRTALRGIWTAAAPSWADHAGHIDARSAAVTEAMLDAACLHRRAHVLELACGPGGVGIAAAKVVGPDGAVVLSDFAPEMTATAAERAQAAGLTNVTTRELNLEQIDYPEAAFDAVLCREGLMLVLDPASALREARRILRPDGRAVFSVWGPRRRNPWLGLLLDAVTAQLGVPVPPPGVPGPFALDGDGALEALLPAAGFVDVTVHEIPIPLHAASVDEWWSLVPSLAGPIAQLLASLPAEATAAIRAHAEAAMAEFATSAGYELPGISILASGRRDPQARKTI